MNLKINCDGGARGNPGPSACAFVIKNDSGNMLDKCGKYLGVGTNNEAEYWAVIEALKHLLGLKMEVASVRFVLDSTLVVNQLNGLFKVKEPRLRELMLKIRELEQQLSPIVFTYQYVPRAQNFEADFLVNETLDRQT